MRNQSFLHGFWKAAGAVPLVLVLALIPVLASRDSRAAMEAPLLLAWLNTIFLGGIPLVLSFLAARNYQITGARLFLMLGCGLLSYGVSSLLAGWAMPLSGQPNATVTLHNLGCLVAGVCHLLGAHYVLADLGGVLRPSFHVRRTAVPYLAILAFWIVVLWLVLHDKLPAYFVPGYGPTPMRQFVLGGALFMFALSGFLFLKLARILKTDFAYWYGLALLMIAGGLAFVLLQPVVGGILGWAGRGAQYLGSLYFIGALWRGRVEFRRASQVSAPAAPAMFWPNLGQQIKERVTALEQANESLRREIAARQQADAALREREALYRAVVETSADGFWMLDTAGRLLEVNDTYARLSGYSREELLTLSVADLEAQEAPEETLAHIQQIQHTGSDLFETRHRTKDGTIWQVEVNVSCWPIAGGRFFVFLRDLRRRNRSEALLRARLKLSELALHASIEELMQAALDEAELFTGSRIGFFHFVDADQEHLTLQAWSSHTRKKMCQAAGQGLHYPISQAGVWVDCFHGKAPVIHNDYARLPHKKGMPEGHAAVVRELAVPILRGGSVVAILGVGNKSTDYTPEDVEVVRALGSIAMDIVDRKRTEEALRDSEEKFRAIANYTVDWESWTGVNGKLVWVNPGVERFTGYSVAECLAMPDYPLPLMMEADRALVREKIREVLLGSRGNGVAFRVLRKDGAVRWGEVSWQPIFDQHGRPLGSRGSIRDITERKMAEQNLRASEEKFHTLFEQMSQGVFYQRADGMLIDVNPAALRMLGLSREDFLTRRSDDQRWTVIREDGSPLSAQEHPSMVALATGRSVWNTVAGVFNPQTQDFVWLIINATPQFRPGETSPYQVFVTLHDITERKRAEEALRESEARFRRVVEHIGDALIVDDASGRITFANDRFLQMFGVARERVHTLVLEDYVAPEYRALLRDRHERRIHRESVPARFEYQGLRQDGTRLWLEVDVVALTSPDGAVTGTQSAMRDITTRLFLRRALEDEATRRRLLFEQSRDGIVVLDQTGKVYEANRRFAGMLGYSIPEVQQLYVWDWDAQWTREELLEQIQKVDAAGDVFETRHRRKDGGMLDVEISTNGFEWEGRKQVFCVCRDITERKLVDEALRESEARFRNLLHNVPSIGVQGFGMDGTVQYWNQASELLYGYAAREAVGRNLVDLIIPTEMRAEFARAMEWMAKTGQPIPAAEMSLLRVDGSRVEVFSSHVLVQKPGREPELFCIDIDITGRKRAEEELRASREQLRALASRLQAAREEERRRIAREIHDVLAQELTRLKIDLAWLQRRLGKPVETDTAHQMSARVSEMTQAADAAITCVQEIATELRPVVLDSLGLAAAVEWHVRDFQRRTGIQCEASVPEEDVPLNQERATVVYRILQEALTNAARHAQASRVEVSLRHEAGWVVLTVRDNGRGMEAKTLNNPLSIGLAGMRERAALPGGQLEITSEPGAGTVVAARIPVG